MLKALLLHGGLHCVDDTLAEVLLSSDEGSPLLEDVPSVVNEVVLVIPVDDLFYLLTQSMVQ